MTEPVNEWRRSARRFGVAVMVIAAVIAVAQGVIAGVYGLTDAVLILETVAIFGIGLLAYAWSRGGAAVR